MSRLSSDHTDAVMRSGIRGLAMTCLLFALAQPTLADSRSGRSGGHGKGHYSGSHSGYSGYGYGDHGYRGGYRGLGYGYHGYGYRGYGNYRGYRGHGGAYYDRGGAGYAISPTYYIRYGLDAGTYGGSRYVSPYRGYSSGYRLPYATPSYEYSDDTPWYRSLRHYTPRDYSPRDYSPRDYSPRDYSPRDYSPRDYSHPSGGTRDTSSLESAEDFAFEAIDVRPEPARLSLAILPPDASVYLDGRFLGPAGALEAVLLVEPGSHVVEIVRPGFEARRFELEAKAAEDVELEAELEATDEP